MLTMYGSNRNCRAVNGKVALRAEPVQTVPLSKGLTQMTQDGVTSQRKDTFARVQTSISFPEVTTNLSVLRFGSRETNQQVEAVLNHMPLAHVRELSLFFRLMMKSRQTPIGYTMFGDKPMSFIECDEVKEFNLMSAYGLWQRYARQLPMDNTLLRIARVSPDDPLPDIYIINKAAFLKTVRDHLDLFKTVLGHNITPERLLDDIMADDSPILSNKLNDSQRLYGLLFGLTPKDTEDADSFTSEPGSLPAHMIPVRAFDPSGNQHYRRVGLPLGLNIHGCNPQSFALVRHWKEQQPFLQQIADIPNDRNFLRTVMRKWADASSYPELPIWDS